MDHWSHLHRLWPSVERSNYHVGFHLSFLVQSSFKGIAVTIVSTLIAIPIPMSEFLETSRLPTSMRYDSLKFLTVIVILTIFASQSGCTASSNLPQFTRHLRDTGK